ncbi:uncharacterized protein LOC102703077 isoform X2 [Oryza brachyantha]|uniref:uncharacterized protein LOC102703077 isoform X2 n=1 Tax=Oryza brachyantha TaxID=4533 RepID=UPI001ADA7EDE|nr:uncharacterized protein LOC102703077 isoform X2 [Oryza brachyantha]
MDPVRREADRGAVPEFVAVDIGGEAESPEAEAELKVESSFAGKGLERERSGDANPSTTGVLCAYEKQVVPVHVDGSPKEQFHPSTPTASGAKRRRTGRRVPGWRDPRKILFAFAALGEEAATSASAVWPWGGGGGGGVGPLAAGRGGGVHRGERRRRLRQRAVEEAAAALTADHGGGCRGVGPWGRRRQRRAVGEAAASASGRGEGGGCCLEPQGEKLPHGVAG